MKEDYKQLDNYIRFLKTEEERNHHYQQLSTVLPHADKLTHYQKDILHHVQNSIDVVNTILSPLKSFGIDYHMIVTGGAVYDLVLGLNDIKDVDIVVYFPKITPHYYELHQQAEHCFSNLTNQLLTPVYQYLFPYSYKNTFGAKDFTDIIAKLVQEHYESEKFYSHESKAGAYLNKVILGLCKIKDKLLDKPIDLIISNIEVEEYINFFDFSICKMMMLCKSSEVEVKQDDLIDYIFMTRSALHDIKHKKITLKVDNFSIEHIDYFLKKHFLRVKEKLPNYTFNLLGYDEEKKNFAQTIYEKIYFEQQINLGIDKNNSLKI